MERIVVGVDGSPGSRLALERAIEEARAHGGRIEAVHAWHVPPLAVYPYGALAFDPGAFEEGASATLDEVVDSTDTSGLAEPVERIVVCGTAARALLGAAKGADLLVVGSRGLGGFTGLVLGSVGEQCVRHAGCPVLVVRPHEG
jgi:nucleotide-binding universal stress UspA family protein